MGKGERRRQIDDRIAYNVAELARSRSGNCESAATSGRVRVGVDVTLVDDVSESLARFGERYIRRVFTPAEGAYCLAGAGRTVARRLAARFAAKEATLKVLRPESSWTDWRSIEVRRHQSGWCDVVLHGEAALLGERQGVTALALSLTHAADCVVAVVLGETWAEPGGARGQAS